MFEEIPCAINVSYAKDIYLATEMKRKNNNKHANKITYER
jgi:hypothetical protein